MFGTGERARPSLRLDLLGPVRLTGPDGGDLTPGSPHRKALLAVVALTGETGVARARLQDLFWGEKDPALAAQSLRTALHGLRRDLDCGDGQPVLETSDHQVRLVPGRVRVDLLAFLAEGPTALPVHLRRDPPDVLEGVDINSNEFEEWLRETRMVWGDRIAESDPVPAVPNGTGESAWRDRRPVVALLPPVMESQSMVGLLLGESLLDGIANGLRDYAGTRVMDHRAELGALVREDAPDLYLRFRLYEIGDSVSVRVMVLNRMTSELLWSVERGPIARSRARLEHAEILGLMGEVIERVAATLSKRSRADDDAPITPFHALTSMFRLDHDALPDLDAELTRAWSLTEEPVYAGLLAYLRTFQVGEHWQPKGTPEEETRRLVSLVRGAETSGGLAYGLAGHALGYVLHDHAGAADMLDHSLRLAPQSAFCWDHLALHFTYTSRYDHAQEASRNALRIGAFSPINFTMQTTRTMIATLQGDFETATDLGARVLSRRPNYGAGLRYMSVALAHQDDIEGAWDCVRRIRAMDPNFSIAWVEEDRMAVRDEAAKAILSEGLAKAGAK